MVSSAWAMLSVVAGVARLPSLPGAAFLFSFIRILPAIDLTALLGLYS